MHIKQVKIEKFKRFTDLTISNLPQDARLIVMTGPNGSGKSSIFDAFKIWSWSHGSPGNSYDVSYHNKTGYPIVQWPNMVNIEFYEPEPTEQEARKKLFYIRSAYRNEADFTINNLSRTGSALDSPRISKLIDNDASVSDNYLRLVSASIEGLYDGDYDALKVSELREKFIGKVRSSMSNVFDQLLLHGPGHPLNGGTFFFDKGISKSFHYKNLSGGEKAAFDILLDVIVKQTEFDNTVFCIDEPEEHMHTKLQAMLLKELFSLIPQKSQLWIATHSIGMMRMAKDLQDNYPQQVVFIDFHEKDFDNSVEISPTKVDREFWSKTLSVALDDLANLVAPTQVVLCEGKPANGSNKKVEFDARCYKTIFSSEYYDTDFLSVGNAIQVQSDSLQIGRAIQTLISGTKVIKLVDRDDRSEEEIRELSKENIRVLTKRHIEAYLLDDEILTILCNNVGQIEKVASVISAKKAAIAKSVERGNPPDDIKSAAGDTYVEIKRILHLTQKGNTCDVFMRETLAPLVTADTNIYKQLKNDIFGE